VFDHNIFFGNSRYGIEDQQVFEMTFGCNDWFGNHLGTTHNQPIDVTDLMVDPMFCNAREDSVTLSHTSPVLDASGCGLIGALGEGCVEPSTATLLTSMTATSSPDGIRIHWSFGGDFEPSDVRLERAPAATGPWQSLSGIARDGTGFSFFDHDVVAGATYLYRLSWTTEGGGRAENTVDARASGAHVELAFSLAPNPATTLARFEFAIPLRGVVDLDVLDLQGRRVARVANGVMEAGPHTRTWQPTVAGRYFARLRFGGRTIVRELAVTR